MQSPLLALAAPLFLISGTVYCQPALPRPPATNSTSTITEAIQSPGIETNRTRNPESSTTVDNGGSALGILVKGGQAYLMRGGQSTPITTKISLSVSPDGTITGFDGQTIILPEGQMLTMDGRFTAITDSPINSKSQPSAATAAANEEMARANYTGRPASTITGSQDPGMMEKNVNGRDGADMSGPTPPAMDGSDTMENKKNSKGSSRPGGSGSGGN